MLTVDAGSLWTTRRTIITGTDAAVLDAARLFASRQLDPCNASDIAAAEISATNVLLQNHPSALHNADDTPSGFAVTVAGDCSIAGFHPGKVRFDAKLQSHQTFSGMFGFSNLRAFSSSTAAFGYVTAIGDGLRPIAVCDQTQQTWPDPLPPAPAAPYYPHYKLWDMLYDGLVDQSTYDGFFGTDPNEYPTTSTDYENGTSSQNPNRNQAYVAPGSGHHTIHRLKMPDARCGVSPGNRIWVDLTGTTGGTVGTNELRDQILYGYKGTVSLTPHDCNPGDGVAPPENCGSATGDRSTLERALGTITCDKDTLALQCPYVFAVPVVRSITMPGSTAEYDHVAFLFLVLRGFGNIIDTGLQMDFEFVDVMTTGQVSSTPVPNDAPPVIGMELCGADHAADYCGF
jgi:hypothetical protein